MELRIDSEAKALYLKLTNGKVQTCKEAQDGIILDLDETGEVVGLEILGLPRETLEDQEQVSQLVSRVVGEVVQSRPTSNGGVHFWPRGSKEPPGASYDICDLCWKEKRIEQRLQIDKHEFLGKKGKVQRDRICPVHGWVRGIKRQRAKDSRWVLKEPERHAK